MNINHNNPDVYDVLLVVGSTNKKTRQRLEFTPYAKFIENSYKFVAKIKHENKEIAPELLTHYHDGFELLSEHENDQIGSN